MTEAVATATPVSTKSVMKMAWNIARSARAKFGGKVRHFFGPALKHAWAVYQAPKTMRFRIVRIDDITRRSDGSVSSIRALVESSAGLVTISSQTRISFASDLVVDGSYLVLTGDCLRPLVGKMLRAKADFDAKVAEIASVSKIGAKLLRIGNHWEKNGHSRIYFGIETLCDAAGFACNSHGTGNMSWAAQDGVEISNDSGRRFYDNLLAAKIHFDLVERKWSCMDTISDESWARIKKSLIARAEGV